ncbi:integrase core domain-containing protein [Streptomyces sp. MMS24-I2-30]|uniref:integrase core domain-containing protein n=1 Tax=Streptomyces sp. MMS24-I2-30 TaxID=3351564 RepID=UPI0038969A31
MHLHADVEGPTFISTTVWQLFVPVFYIRTSQSPSGHTNALAESFNAALKRETLRSARRFDGARACRLTVFRWTTRYNTRRRHSANGHQAPIVYEQQSATLTLAA